MEIPFFMGTVVGALVATFYWLVIAKTIRNQVYKGMIQALKGTKKKRRTDTNDDGANFWKPPNWRPDKP